MSTRIPLAPGTVLGRYQLLGLSGEGGMGDIYKALDTSLERTVALKRVRSGRPDDATQERFRREALALAQLNHPGICQVYELAETVHGTFIVLEWVEGETLADRLGRGTLPWREAAALLRQAADALAAAHAKGLVHRDLKPSNIMVTPDGRAKVLDFGLVRFAGPSAGDPPEDAKPPTGEVPALPGDELTAPGSFGASGSGRGITLVGTFMGTLGYTSPEQALARPVGPPSDIFGLGILAHELVAGDRPFTGEGRAALDSVVDNQRAHLSRQQAPKAYRNLVDRMLAPKPKERPSAEEVATSFADMLSPLNPLWWSGLSAASVLLLVLGGYWLFGRGVLAGLVKGRPARVAVMGFKNETGQPSLTAQTELGLTDLVAASLRHSPKLQVLDSDALAQAAHALKLNPAEASPADQQRLAKALGADLLLTGEVTRSGGKDQLHYALKDTSGRMRSEGNVQVPSASGAILQSASISNEAARRLMKAVDPFAKETETANYTISPEAFAAYAQGVEAYRHRQFAEAEPLLAKAANTVPEWTGAVKLYAATLLGLFRPETDPTLHWALVAARNESNDFEESAVLQLFSLRALSQHDFVTAATYDEGGLKQARNRGDLGSEAFWLNNLGRVAISTGSPVVAVQRYTEALRAATQANDRFMESQILTNLGNIALERGDVSEAKHLYQEVVDTAHSVGDESGEALGLNNLGITLLSSFQPQEARGALERSLILRKKNGEARGVVSGYRNLGICAQLERQTETAHSWFQRSLNKALSISDTYGGGQARFYLAELDRRSGQLPKAIRGYQEASQESEATHDTTRLGQELAAKAECLMRLHKSQSAKPILTRAESLIPGNPYLLRALAWEAFLKGDRALALDRLNQAIQDPKHDAPEIRDELERLLPRFKPPPSLP